MTDLHISYQNIQKNDVPFHRFTMTCANHDWHGKKTVFELYRLVEVKDSSPVNYDAKILTRMVTLDTASPTHIDVPFDDITIYPYQGTKINIAVQSRVRITRDWALDKHFKQSHYIHHKQPKYKSPHCAKRIMEPKDHFHLLKNLSALAPQNLMLAFVLLIAGLIVIVINTLIGIHDQIVPEMQTWLYSHTDSDGDGTSPLIQSLAGSGGIGAFIWYLLKKQLRKYMQFHFRHGQNRIKPRTNYALKNMVAGRARVDLKNITLRVVAANVEHGAYMRGSGSNRRRVDFSNPVNGIILYQENIAHIPAKMPLHDYISNRVFTFDEIYRKLYPPQMLGKNHGLDLRWEVQLIHGEFIDQELVGANNIFNSQDFWDDLN